MRKPHSVTDPRADRRKIVKQGEIVFETSDPNSTRNLIERLVKETQGYISEDAQNKTDNEVRTRVIIRVPAENFDELVKLIIAGVPYVEKKFITASDITEDYIDIEARIRTQKELELRYIELLKQARKMEDIIGINQELTNVRENIESTQGKLKHLAHCVAYSFLTIEYYQQSTSVSRFFGKIWQGMKSGWKYFAIFIIGLAQVWPFLVIAVIVVFIIRARKKKSAQKLS
ncbi:MAG TPA: DUF4349 domain-containing protein [Bacteroidales bacterium]|nr:DUF4349 domain-containing protein [Bacteroidales bacterium]